MEFNEKLLKDTYFSQAMVKIRDIVKIKSFAQTPTKDAPYGIGVAEVLTFAMELGESLGFTTVRDPKGKYGYLEFGEGEEIFAILGHLDVVPPGNLDEWKIPPFNPEIIDDILYGRGVLDDKGPTIIILYCLKYLKDHGYVPKRRIRVIFGLTEETTWDSINTYMKQEGSPTFGFTPDGMFPLVYAEKGIIDLDIIGAGHNTLNINAGVAYNVTCSTSTISGVDIDNFVKLGKNKKYRIENKDKQVIIHGTPAHGSRPSEGINAGLQSLLLCNELNIKHNLVQFVGEILHEDTALTKYFGDLDDESGSFTINVGIVNIDKKSSILGCNIRIPVKTDLSVVIKRLDMILKPYDLTIKERHYDKPLYMPQDSTIVVELMKIYHEVTGDKKAVPIAIGGGTYARAMDNCVAFGAIFDHLVSTEHQYNESVKVDELWKSMLIYVRAISTLGMLDKFK
ncbi:Sapep family Mn(2+)-dependent dipeptidase [Spiroplasma endosymbiont of Nebria brevicollis]|uniref:Sapep family Mn(2+)-dependent dipeptidase n=1 Tax=Spiroplasma endosymbiont of Nebria brevicollis TaxID=3066284 RepID=UPI00313CAE9F